ncbi:glycoside hydrolase family 81 protein [Xylariomycetidae sp. FL0641]|nr:glycoside hydrolase family 81 protein [Xylariomycetidae sp. FL0641]
MLLALWILTCLQVFRVRAIPLVITTLPCPSPGQTQDPHREGYAPVTANNNAHRESYRSVSVLTTSDSTGIVQIPPSQSGVSPDTSGVVVTSLETSGRVGTVPLLTSPIPEPTGPITSSPPELEPSSAEATPSTTPTMPEATASSDIFGSPIANTAPSSVFPVHKDHPVPRKGITSDVPVGTNKFFANFFLGNQNSPGYVHPYSVTWARGGGATSSWGMAISHVDTDQVVFGEVQQATGAAQYFANPVGIQSLCLSAAELGKDTSLTTDDHAAHSINVNLHANSKSPPLIIFPLVQGMGLVTAAYKGGTPVINTGVQFKRVTKSTEGPRDGVTKYTLYLEDGKVWHVYAYSEKGDPFDLNVANSTTATAGKAYNGIVQVAKDPGDAEAIIDAAAGAYPVKVALSGTASGKTGTYTFSFQKAGFSNVPLLMYALPHHVESFDDETKKAASKSQLQTTTKGMAVGIVADKWTMVEPNMPTEMEFSPWDPDKGPKKTLSDQHISAVSAVALKELQQSVDQQSNQDSMYFSGKALAKFAQLCLVSNDMLKNSTLAKTGLGNLQAAFTRFISNKQKYPLFYETAWGGLVSSASYATGDDGKDFGNTYYNDHHFHYGYFIYAAAIVGYLDPTWLTKENVDYINTMVRDIANPSPEDKYFPVFRNFDWYHGHSWAHGLYETTDGKDQESSSEDAMAAYAIKMWGRTIKDANMEARGNLMLSVIARSLNQYYLYTDTNKVQPAKYVGNKVAGILFENKCDHNTYFGSNIEYIQGIHMMPLLPSTKLTRPADFVREEWKTYFDNNRADKIQGGWKGILFGNLGTVDPQSAYDFFSSGSFDPQWLDGGVSLTWYMAYAAGTVLFNEF